MFGQFVILILYCFPLVILQLLQLFEGVHIVHRLRLRQLVTLGFHRHTRFLQFLSIESDTNESHLVEDIEVINMIFMHVKLDDLTGYVNRNISKLSHTEI